MSDRMMTLAGGLLALLLMAMLLSPRFAAPPLPPSKPTSSDVGPLGLAAVSRWVAASGVPAHALHERYDGLPKLGIPERGNLLVIVDPSLHPLRRAESSFLAGWVERGNAVLLLRDGASSAEAAAQRNDSEVPKTLGLRQVSLSGTAHVCEQVSGLEPSEEDEGDEDEDKKDKDEGDKNYDRSGKVDAPHAKTKLKPKPADRPRKADILLKPSPIDIAYPQLAGVRTVAVEGAAWSRRYARVRGLAYNGDADRLSFVWLCDTTRRQPALSQFRVGSGTVWATSYTELFNNSHLDRADNARLFANLLKQSLGPHGAVIFDDMHQGDSVLYDPAALFGDPRLHASLGFLLLIWLVWLLGHSNRFEPPRLAAPGVTPAAFARRIGGFYAQRLAPIEAAEALLARFHADVRQRLKSPGEGPVWDWLQALPGIDQRALAALRREADRLDALHNASPRERGRYPRDLRPLATLIHDLRESLP